MESVWQLLVILAAVGLVVGALWWLAIRARRRGVGGSVLGAVDEVFHPAAYESQIQIQAQSEREVAKPAPGDPPRSGGCQYRLPDA